MGELISSTANVSEGVMRFYTGGRGPTAVFLHGIPGSGATWLKVAGILASRYHVIVPDLMGFGGSSSPVSDYYMETQARCLAELLMSLGVREIHLIAHDFGGPVSVLFSRLFPHLRIVKLVLMATNTFVDTPIPGPLRAARIPLVGRLIIKILAGTEFGFRQIYQNGVKNKEQFSWADFSVHISRRNLYYTYRIFHRSLASLEHNYAGVQKHLKMISSPVLVVWGDSDPFFPVSVGVRLRDEIMDASMLTYNNTGHFIPEERSEQLARDLDQFFATAHGSFSRPLS